MLTLILGPSGSGKSRMLLAELRRRAEAGLHSLILVPEQFTSSTEGALYSTLGDSLSAYVESYSFTTLAETLLRLYGGAAVPTMTDAGRAVLVRRAVANLQGRVQYYGRQCQSTAFCEKAAQTIEELKSAGIRPETLESYARAPGADTAKLGELSLIYGAYEALLQNTAMDPGDRVEQAARTLQPGFFAGRAVYIDEFDTFNASKKAILGAILQVADVTVSLCCDGAEDADGAFGVFSGARRVAATLKALAGRAGVPYAQTVLAADRRHADTPLLAELADLLADPTYTPEAVVDPANPAILQYPADSRQEEAKAVAATIRELAEKGMPYRRMAVICRNAGAYLSAVRYEFRLADIPLFCDEPTTPENTAPARAVAGALELLRGGISTAGVLQLLKTGLVNLPEAEQCALENYAYTWTLYAADWREPFTRSPAGYTDRPTPEDAETLRLAEAARQFLVGNIQRFVGAARGADAATLTTRIYLFLQALGAETALTELAAALRREGDIPAAEEALREWNTVMALLDEMVRLLGEGASLSPTEYGELFTLLLRTTDMGHIPQSLDSVIFTTAGRMRLPETDACFVLGLTEGEFPQTPGDTGLLSHADRDSLMSQGADLPDCFENRVVREQVCFYKALTAARKFLWLSWPGGAAGLPVAAALAPVLEAFNVPVAALTPRQLAPTPAAALDLLGSLWQQNSPQRAAVYAALAQVAAQPGGQGGLPGFAAVHRAAEGLPLTAQDTAALESVLGRSLRISPTRFESYTQCPFGYFMEYVLRAKPRQKAELAPNISGTLTHWVLENALRRTGDGFLALDAGKIAALVEELVAEYVAANLPGAGVRMQYLLGRISKNLVGLLRFIQEDRRQSGFQPVAYELRIADTPDPDDPTAPLVPPVELDDGRGHTIRVIGTIDRVDAMQAGGKTYLRVVDYKTGNKEFSLKEVYFGQDCQMLLYLFTLVRNGGGLYPGAAAAGVEYLLADPSPKTAPRPEPPKKDGAETGAEAGENTAEAPDDAGGEAGDAAGAGAEAAPPAYPLQGLLLDEESIYRAMDRAGTGRYLPLNFGKNGKPTPASAAKVLATEKKLGNISRHIDGLLTQMAQNLYSGNIAAEPLCPSGNTRCQWCDYRAACLHVDGRNERTPTAPEKPFEEE
ncbi:MAG: PD-(D/E)XK nuclease family protein [Gemmiger sp.]|nr:PD-(D/E)XK nuclease family protein [Gemmiger sp.]